jgi:hypothetical protein
MRDAQISWRGPIFSPLLTFYRVDYRLRLLNSERMVALVVGPTLLVSFSLSLIAGKVVLHLILGSLDRDAAPARLSNPRPLR